VHHVPRRSPSNFGTWGPPSSAYPADTQPPHPKTSKMDTPDKHSSTKRRKSEKEAITTAWARYEHKWDSIKTTQDNLTEDCVPWPVIHKAALNGSQSEVAVSVKAFLLSPYHSHEVPRKKRILDALRLYHPDRFGKVISRVSDAVERKELKEIGDILVRCLNELLEEESRA